MSKDDKKYLPNKGKTSEEIQRQSNDKFAQGKSTLASSSQGTKNIDTKKPLSGTSLKFTGDVPVEDRSIQKLNDVSDFGARAKARTEASDIASRAQREARHGAASYKGLDELKDLYKKGGSALKTVGKFGLKGLGLAAPIAALAAGSYSSPSEAAETGMNAATEFVKDKVGHFNPSVMGDATIKSGMIEQYEKDQAELKAARLQEELQATDQKPNRFSNFRF